MRLPTLPGVGATIGPYRLLEVLGQGGMGVVYRGAHPETDEAVAVKTVRAASEVPLASIRREIHALRRLRHPGVVRIVAEGVTDGLPWYAMELLRGQTLRGDSPDVDAGPMTPERLKAALTLVRRMCGPLAFLHANGIVHRDLKPENVFLRPDGTPVLVDFGIAARFGGSRGRETLDVSGTVVGSDAYMAPEQLRGDFVDARADLYALGCILYERLTGRPPFLPGREGPVPHQHLHVAPVPPSQRVEGIPEAVDTLVLWMLAKKPQARPGYAGDVAAALEALGAEGGGEDGTAPRTPTYLYRPDLAGRGGELARLVEALDAAARGQGGRVFLGGESGAGKTRLALELASEAAWRRMAVVTGECVPMGVGGPEGHMAPLQPLRSLLLAVADRCNERGAEEANRLLGPRGRVLAAYEPSLSQLPGQREQPEPPALPAPEARARVLAALRDTLRAFAEVQPLLLVLDDLQWADELTLSFLQELDASRLASRPVLLVGTYRMDEMGPTLLSVVGASDAVRVEVGRLDAASAGEMVRGMLALREVPRPFVDALVRETSGNPFFIAEYLRAAIGAGLLFRAPSGEWLFEAAGTAGNRPLPLPGSIVELIERRLADLGPEGRALAEVASVLGRELDAELLLATAALPEHAGLEAVEELRRRQVLEESGGGRLRFVHDKLREVAYGHIPAGHRRALHLKLAETLERRHAGTPEAGAQAAALAHHWSRAGVPARASGWFARAGDSARDAYANGDAIAFYGAALREAKAATDEAAAASTGNAGASAPDAPMLALDRVWEGLGEVLAFTGRQAEARAAFMEALARIPQSERVRRANVLRKVGRSLQTHHENEEALRVYARAEAELGPAPGPATSESGERESAWWREWVQLQGERITVHYWLAQLEEMRALVDGVRPLVRTHGTPLERARFFNALVQMQLRGERYQASSDTVAHARAFAEAALEAGGDAERAGARCVLATVLLFHGALAEAQAEMEVALREAEHLGDVTLQTRCLTYLTFILRLRGQVEPTREATARSLEMASTAKMADYVGAAHANRAWVALREGDLPAAHAAGTEALRLWQPLSLVYPFQWLAHWPLLAVALEAGQVAEALEHARAMLASNQQRLPDALTAPLAAALASGDGEGARAPLRQASEAARELCYL
ncbi:serine/threonine-protein kinase [Pyxidicoccus xibeiensis]|uniref:serine/threonine-protein kinase n=1 Tax=Pyxidicoccus xibeiensis TaxID=2906759 RepID=UPI0020A7D3A7|nr:AAA family ATPase [Pyxidicoccus xibeiensis]MCP3144107.1 AAA family ATPase [Pyxidicoccus xibeiensis]